MKRTSLTLATLMFVAALLAIILSPSLPDASKLPSIDLADKVPLSFGEWQSVEGAFHVVNPQESEVLDRIYSGVLNRSYRHIQSGQIIMLSIAYGAVQNKESQVHRPEVCYPAQGFQILQSTKVNLQTRMGVLPAQQLVTRMNARNEPLTYWIRVGDRLARGWVEQKYAVVMEGIAGRVSDGLIFRVSSINRDAEASFMVQRQFIDELLTSVKPSDLHFFIGSGLK